MINQSNVSTASVITDTVTNQDGYFTLPDVESGLYNISFTYMIGDVEKNMVVTIEIDNTNEEITVFTIDDSKLSTRVNIESDNMNFVVDDMMNAFDFSDKEMIKDGGSVDFAINITENKMDKVNDVSNAAGRIGKDVGHYFTATGTKTIVDASGNVEKVDIKQLEGLVKFTIKLGENMQNKQNYVLIRYEGTELKEITTKANIDGEYVKLSADGTTLEVYVKTMGNFVIGYDTEGISSKPLLAIVVAIAAVTLLLIIFVVARKKKQKSDKK